MFVLSCFIPDKYFLKSPKGASQSNNKRLLLSFHSILNIIPETVPQPKPKLGYNAGLFYMTLLYIRTIRVFFKSKRAV